MRNEDVTCDKAPLANVTNDDTKAALVLGQLPNHAQLNRKDNNQPLGPT